MNKKLALRTARLASESQKLKSTSNVCTAYEHHPDDPDERRHGILFAVIDVNGSPKHSEDLIELIIDTFHGEYYQDPDKDPLESFENALAKINEELGEFTGNGNTFWMGKLNAILAVFADDTIHITQAGKANAYLYRSGKEIHITDDLAGDSVNPLRTFVNITSGELTEGDRISILSSGILTSCSIDEVSRYVIKYHPKVAINHLASLIEGVGGSYGQNAAIILEFMTPEALANETLDEEPEEIWLQGTTKKEILAEKSGTVLAKILKYLKLAALTILEFYNNTLLPKTKEIFSFLKGKSGEIYDRRASKKKDISNILADTDEKIDGFETEEVPKLEEFEATHGIAEKEALLKAKEKVEVPAYKSEIRIKESDESPNKARFEKTKSTILNNLGSLYGSATQLANFKKTKKKLPKVKLKKNQYLAIGIIILVIFAGYIFITKAGQGDAKARKAQKAQLQEIDAKIAEANSLIGQNEKAKAASDLTDAEKIAQGLVNSKFYAKDAKDKLAAIENQLNTLTQTTQANAAVLADLSGSQADVAGVYEIGNVLYAVSKNGAISKVETKSKRSSQVLSSGKMEGNVIGAATLDKIKTLEILTDKPAVYEFDTTDDSITQKSTSDGWEKALAIDSYGTNLYLLAKDQIYKHTRTSSGYSKGSQYLSNSGDMADPASLKIDSDIYVLTHTGDILKFTSGKKQDFSVKDIPISLSSADFIYTDSDTKYILAGSKSDKSIVVIGKDGSYKGRYTAGDFSDLRGACIAGNTVYAATKDKVLSFEIK